MKIAIADRKGSFSDYWITYCEENNIPFIRVNPYDSDIIDQVKNCDAFMWHHHHGNYKDVLFAKQLLFSLEQSGKEVFPNFRTGWHFDDKLGQKYLFESLGIKAAKAWAFYDKKSAYEWIDTAEFPKVFKLRGGASSANVKLVRTEKQAKRLVRKAFGRGFSATNPLFSAKTQWKNFIKGNGRFYDVAKYLGLFLFPKLRGIHLLSRHKGYVYFQEFIPNDGFDYRIIIIGEKAFAIRRQSREGDFRASGSGIISYDNNLFSDELIRMAFEINDKIKSQCLVLDIVINNETDQLYVVEVSYGYSIEAYFQCPGYWSKDLTWHESPVDSGQWIIEEVIKQVKIKKNTVL